MTFFGTQLANPDLEEERFNSLELGLEQEFLGNSTVSITGYAHFLEDAIGNPNFNQFVNTSGTSEVFGIDAALAGSFIENFYYKVAWNYSIKNDVIDGFPRNTANLDTYYDGGKWLLGLGASTRSSASFDGPRELDSNCITRIYGHYQLTENIRLTARIENLFDEEYELDPFAFDPVTFASAQGDLARGTSFFAGVKATW